jgi:hypothetical protein
MSEEGGGGGGEILKIIPFVGSPGQFPSPHELTSCLWDEVKSSMCSQNKFFALSTSSGLANLENTTYLRKSNVLFHV